MKAPPASLSSCDQAFQICRPLLRSPAKSPAFVAICRRFRSVGLFRSLHATRLHSLHATGMRITLFTLLDIRLVPRLCVFYSKCWLTRFGLLSL
nr:hypothetical protein Iba_chr08dCG10230 [Ipomoea batatas]